MAMHTRERFRAIMAFRPFDRLPLLEWAGWWGATIDRWHQEGLPGTLVDRYEICRHFGLDIYKHDWIAAQCGKCPRPTACDTGIATNETDYDRVRPLLYPRPAVDRGKWELWARDQAHGDTVVWFTFEGFFRHPREILGVEGHQRAFRENPGLMHRISADLAEWMLATVDELCTICVPDLMTFAEDLCCATGPMISREVFSEFMAPYYARVIPALRRRGIIPFLDSGGDITAATAWFDNAGIEGILPLERQACVDITHLRANHPRMKFIGHFDRMTMDQGEPSMRREFERLLPVAAQGGFLVGCDDQTPPVVSYRDYLTYLKLFREYAVEAGRMSRTTLACRSADPVPV